MSASPTPIIRVEELKAAYGELVVFDGVSFEVSEGEVLVVVGGSGCGKSTLLKHMIGLLSPVAGRVLIDGDDLTAARGDARNRTLRKLGVMYQTGALFGSMTLLDNIILPLEEFTSLPPEAIATIALKKLELVGLGHVPQLMPADLSGGMKKRGAIARAMALDPRILFLDEPSAGLDPVTSVELDRLILGLAKSLGITFVVVSHELASIFAIADRVLFLDRETKGILASGAPEELRDRADLPPVRSFFHREPLSEVR